MQPSVAFCPLLVPGWGLALTSRLISRENVPLLESGANAASCVTYQPPSKESVNSLGGDTRRSAEAGEPPVCLVNRPRLTQKRNPNRESPTPPSPGSETPGLHKLKSVHREKIPSLPQLSAGRGNSWDGGERRATVRPVPWLRPAALKDVCPGKPPFCEKPSQSHGQCLRERKYLSSPSQPQAGLLSPPKTEGRDPS